jgi:hypothetical protein
MIVRVLVASWPEYPPYHLKHRTYRQHLKITILCVRGFFLRLAFNKYYHLILSVLLLMLKNPKRPNVSGTVKHE